MTSSIMVEMYLRIVIHLRLRIKRSPAVSPTEVTKLLEPTFQPQQFLFANPNIDKMKSAVDMKGLILKGALRPGSNCNPNNTILKKYKRKLTGGGYPGVCDPNNPYCYNECSDVTCCYVCIDFEFYLSVTQSQTQSSNLLII